MNKNEGIVVFSHDLPHPDYPGESIREVNLKQQHNIPLGALVEFCIEHWHGGGACERTIGRLWVVTHTHDCDGTPLYTLAGSPESISEDAPIREKLFWNVKSGFSEESLRVVTITKEVEYGRDMPEWQNVWKEEED